MSQMEIDGNESALIDTLPNETLLNILSFLPGKDVLLHAALVSSRWKSVTDEQELWRLLLERGVSFIDRESYVKPPQQTWKWIYRSKLIEFKGDKLQKATGIGKVVKDDYTYEGDWKDGKYDGFGVQIYNSSGAVYVGEFARSQAEGKGKYIWKEGDVYEGDMKHGHPHGFGEKRWPTGESYVGNWINGMRMGEGKYTWPNGHTFEGIWKDKALEGRGIYAWNGGRKYDGNWVASEKSGQGTYTWPDGEQYVGEWHSGLRQGQGTMTWADGTKFVGTWEADVRQAGQCYNADGTPADPFAPGSQPYDDYFTLPDEAWEEKYGNQV